MKNERRGIGYDVMHYFILQSYNHIDKAVLGRFLFLATSFFLLKKLVINLLGTTKSFLNADEVIITLSLGEF